MLITSRLTNGLYVLFRHLPYFNILIRLQSLTVRASTCGLRNHDHSTQLSSIDTEIQNEVEANRYDSSVCFYAHLKIPGSAATKNRINIGGLRFLRDETNYI